MADESASIALQFTVQMRGLTKVTQLNAALKEMKTNIIGVQRGIREGATNLKNMGAGAQAAAKGMKDLAKASEAVAKSRGRMDPLGKDIANIQKQRAREEAAYGKLMLQAEQKNARAAVAIAKQKAAQQAAAQRGLSAAVTADLRRMESVTARFESKRTAIAAREAAKRDALEERSARRTSASLRVRLTAWEEHYDAIFRAGFRLQMVGNDLKQLGMVGVNALRGVSDEFANFEFMVNRAAGAVGLARDETDAGVNIYNRFTDAIQDAAMELRFFKPEEVAKATYYWASTSGQQIDNLEDLRSVMKSVNPLMKIAAMTETDYETAIKGVYSILTQYGMGLDQTAEVTQKLHMVTQRTAAEFPDLVNSFKMVGPVAKEFGVTFDDMVVLLGRLADAGIRGTMSGRAFRQFFIQISRPAPKATEALEDLWASTEKFGNKSYLDTVFPEGKFIGVNNYVNELALRLQNATDKERMFTLATITTANELPVLTALVSKQIQEIKGLGDGWDYSKENLETAAEGFASSWEILRTSWKGTIGAITRGVEIIRLKVGKQLAEILAPTFEKFATALERVHDWFDDANNGPMIEFATRLVAISSAALVVAGSIAAFGGALVGLFAVLKVVFGAFSPLLKAFSMAGGIIVAFAAAVVRNFDYIRETVLEAFEIIQAAIGENQDSWNAIGEAVAIVGQVVGAAMDIIVRAMADFIRVAAQVTAAIIGSEHAMAILQGVATVLAAVIAGKLVLSFVNLARSMVMLPFAAVAKGFQSIALATAVSGGGITGFAKGLGMLLPALGPAGWLVAGLAAAGVALAVLYNNNAEVKASVDRFVFEWMTGLDTIIERANDAREALGINAPQLDTALNADPAYRKLEAEVKRLEHLAESQGTIFFGEDYRKQLDTARKDLAQWSTDAVDTMRNTVDQLNGMGANITLEEYVSRLTFDADRLGTTIRDSAAKGATWDFFRTAALDAKAANEQARDLLNTMEAPGWHSWSTKARQMDPATFSRLVGLQATGKLEGATRDAVAEIVNAGMAEGLGAVDPPTEEAVSMWNAFGSTMLATSSELSGLDEKLTEIMEEAIRPGKQVEAVFESYLTGWISKGFRDADGHYHLEAEMFAQNTIGTMGTQWQLYADNLPPADAKKFVWDTMVQFKEDFKNGLPAAVTPEMAVKIAEFMGTVYTEAGKPWPQWAIDMFKEHGVTVTDGVVTGISSGAGEVEDAGETVPKQTAKGMNSEAHRVTTAALNIADRAKNGVRFYKPNQYWGWGAHLGQNFARGLNAQGTLIYETALGLAKKAAGPLKHSTPVEGPLKDDDTWGLHMGENLAMGMLKSIPAVSSAAYKLADAAALSNQSFLEGSTAPLSMETSANRTIKVQVEVTSPDGSVDRVKAAEFERALMSNDLLMSIEHMATVG